MFNVQRSSLKCSTILTRLRQHEGPYRLRWSRIYDDEGSQASSPSKLTTLLTPYNLLSRHHPRQQFGTITMNDSMNAWLLCIVTDDNLKSGTPPSSLQFPTTAI